MTINLFFLGTNAQGGRKKDHRQSQAQQPPNTVYNCKKISKVEKQFRKPQQTVQKKKKTESIPHTTIDIKNTFGKLLIIEYKWASYNKQNRAEFMANNFQENVFLVNV